MSIIILGLNAQCLETQSNIVWQIAWDDFISILIEMADFC